MRCAPEARRRFCIRFQTSGCRGWDPKTSTRLNAAGLARIFHIAATPLEMLELLLGNQAAGIRQFAYGIDERPLIPAREPQKVV